MNLINYKRFQSNTVKIGEIPIGADFPIRLQSMTNTDTLNIHETVEQCKKIIDEGADFVRLTTQTVKHAEKLSEIKAELHKAGYPHPIIADVHFNPKVAEIAAEIVEKVRINPGNYIAQKQKNKFSYTAQEYDDEIKIIQKRIRPLLEICKKNNTVIRIGTNHGSLSERIMSKYGDTPKGMVEATMEFLRICKEENFYDIVISLKSSNTVVMVQACRLLVEQMKIENMYFPVHLGVTEAGNDKEGRVKSAVGIGALLVDGIGDTIRVSLTESPEKEIPVAKLIVKYSIERKKQTILSEIKEKFFNPYEYNKRETKQCLDIGSKNVPIVIANYTEQEDLQYAENEQKPDFIYIKNLSFDTTRYPDLKFIINYENWTENRNSFPFFNLSSFLSAKKISDKINFIKLSVSELHPITIDFLKKQKNIVLISDLKTNNFLGELRLLFNILYKNDCKVPVIIKNNYQHNEIEHLQIQAAINFGSFFIDGFGNGIFINNKGKIKLKTITDLSFNILQATRVRISKTEYISCPGCGRTLFDLEATVAEIKEKTSHLKNLKIGIMGCIVNGPGEMADADYGYVGAKKNLITLYKNKKIIKKNIPEHQAVDELLNLIKENNDWK